MPSRVPSILTTCALVFGASSALAQTPEAAQPASATAVSPLTIQGAAPPKVIEKQAWSVVQVYAAATPKLGLIGRWREPICIQVVNLTPDQAALVQARVEEVARGVGLTVRKPGCKANVQIVLSSLRPLSTRSPRPTRTPSASTTRAISPRRRPSPTRSRPGTRPPPRGGRWEATA